MGSGCPRGWGRLTSYVVCAAAMIVASGATPYLPIRTIGRRHYVPCMNLHGVIELTLAGAPILRRPNLWDKARRAFGGEPDLRTDQERASV